MCGLIFLDQDRRDIVTMHAFQRILNKQLWRGPDAQHCSELCEGRVLVGHQRLSILDPTARSNQPMTSRNGRYMIIYNGEIYNHCEVRKRLNGPFRTHSDTETILEGYAEIGNQIFELIDGMFALVIYDLLSGDWIAARDPFGIKPLFLYRGAHCSIVGSEPARVADLAQASPSELAIAEWRILRRPLPGKSFFQGVEEIQPGTIVTRSGRVNRYWQLIPSSEPYSQEQFNALLTQSISRHELSDVKNVSLLSGGLDSAIITAISSVSRTYCVGLIENNEFVGATDTATVLGREIVNVGVTSEQLAETWRYLTRLRGEPLGLPNEGLIYEVCKQMQADEKVVLTGEGADEILFGYDGIFSWANSNSWLGPIDFLARYGYSNIDPPTERLLDYVESLHDGKSSLDFVEDFFFDLHLTGLLRRMDFASMAASKEARVPFVSKQLVQYMYRRPYRVKIKDQVSKIPIRTLAEGLGLDGALARKKVGFSAHSHVSANRFTEYENFQNLVLGELQWS